MATTFETEWKRLNTPDSGAMAGVVQAYKSGQMNPQESAQFESDVRAGHIMLPRGEALKSAAKSAGESTAPASVAGPVLPDGVLKAYSDGTMPSAEKAQLESDVRQGLVSLPPGVELAQGVARVAIPGAQRVVPPEQAPAPGLADQAIGLGEAGLSAVTGATGGTVGMVAGFGKGLAQEILSGKFGTPQANDMVAQAMNEGAASGTYAPRTQVGQERAAQLGNVMANVLPVAPLAGEMAGLTAGAQAAKGTPAAVLARAGAEGTARDAAGLVARPAEAAGMVAPGAAGNAAAGLVARGVDAAAPVVAKAADAVKGAAQTGADKVASMAKGATTLPRRALEAIKVIKPADEPTPTPGTLGSAGAAGTDLGAQRLALADSLPYPVKLTRGMISRDADQMKFEAETAKMPDVGAPLRNNRIEATGQLMRNFDWLADQTGAEASLPRQVGASVDSAVMGDLNRAKTEVRVAYKKAEAAGEMSAPVALTDLVQHLNEAAPEAATAPLLTTARSLAVKLGIAKEENGVLVPGGQKPGSTLDNSAPSGGVTLAQAERFRQAINRNTDFEPTNIRQATIMKGLIDKATEGMGGDLYKAARQKRMEMAQRFEDRAIMTKLTNNKRGMADRQVAFEDVFQHSILKGSHDDTAHLLGVLKTSGPEGMQAVKELQGATLRHIIDQATKSANSDSAGQRILSPDALNKAVRELDADGKLDLVLGKKNAQFVRDINELTQIAKTIPPEAGVNYSNTSSALLAALGDAGVMSMTGAPIPIVTLGRFVGKYVKDQQLKKRINDALRIQTPAKAPGRRGSTTPEQFPGAAHTVH
jgi:hypothetical protein